MQNNSTVLFSSYSSSLLAFINHWHAFHLSPLDLSFPEFHIKRILQCVLLCLASLHCTFFYFWDPSILLNGLIACSFLLLSNILWHGYCHSLFIYLPAHRYAYYFWLLWIKLLQAFKHKFLHRYIFSFSLVNISKWNC